MSDQEFFNFCIGNPELRIERNSNLEIIIMSPTTSLTGKINTEILRQLSNWNALVKSGAVFDSSAGFTLPDRSVLSPDASWVSKPKWNNLSNEDKDRFAPVCPEFVIEVKSKTDHIEDLQKKMKVWLRNSAIVAWLIDPYEKKTYIYEGDFEKLIYGFDGKVKGSGPIEGFELDLSLITI